MREAGGRSPWGNRAPQYCGWAVLPEQVVSRPMGCSPLVTANRRLIDAMETPPDDGVEERLDEVAALLWAMEHEHVTDPGACCRVCQKLRSLEREVGERRRSDVEGARRSVESYGERLEPV